MGNAIVDNTSQILVVDDEILLASAIEEAINMRDGCSALAVNSAEEALEILETKEFDLVITDIKMPNMDGLTLLERIKGMYPDTEVMMMTAYASIDTAVDALKKGAHDYIRKPLPSLNDLVERVRKALEKRELTLQNKKLQQQLEEQNRQLIQRMNQLRQLGEISKELASSLELDNTLQMIIEKVKETISIEGAALYLCGRRMEESIELHAAYNIDPNVEAVIRQKIVPQLIEKRQGLRLNLKEKINDISHLSLVGVPLIFQEKIIGGLVIHTTQGADQFSDDDFSLLETYADQAAITVENSQLYKEALEQAGKLSIINAVSQSVSGMFEPDQILEAVITQISWIISCDACGLFGLEFTNDQTWEISSFAIDGYPEEDKIPLKPEFTQWLIEKRRPLLVSNVHQDQELAPFYKDSQTHSLLAMLLESKDKLMALFVLEDNARNAFNEEDFMNVQLLANQVSIALENALLFEEINNEKGKIEAILTSTNDLIIVTDRRGKITIINPSAERAFNISGKEVQFDLVKNAIPNDKLQELFEKATTSDTYLSGEITISENGEEKTYYANLSPVKGLSEETIGRVAVMQDITHFKIMDRQKTREIHRQRKEREKVTDILRSYVSHEVVREILADPDKLTLGGERRIITIIFADLCSFTTFAERVPAEKVVSLLNDFFTAMTDIIIEHRGTIDKFMGDCIMAIYGAPVSYEDDVERALQTALHMRRQFKGLKEKWKEDLGIPEFIDISIGINTGEVVVGNVGSSRKMDYTVIGDSVNFASRLEEIAKPRQILISHSTYSALADRLVVTPLSPREIRGKGGLFNIYQLEGFKEDFKNGNE